MNSVTNTSIICLTAIAIALLYLTFSLHESNQQREFTAQMLLGKRLHSMIAPQEKL